MNDRPGKTPNINKYYQLTSVIAGSLLILAIVIATFAVAPPVFASELDDFETAATKDDPKPETDAQKPDDQNTDDQKPNQKKRDGKKHDYHDGGLFDLFFGAIFDDLFKGTIHLVYEGAKMSYARVGGRTDINPERIELRRKGEPTLPFCQFDYKYIHINSDISANDLCLELGNGPFGFECRNTYFNELNPKNDLTLTQYHLLLRMSAKRSLEFGLGIGTCNISGNEKNSGFSLTYPIKIYLNQSFGIRIKPTCNWINSNNINDTDLTLVFTKRFGTVELGYRFLEANGRDLDGAYIGFAYHY